VKENLHKRLAQCLRNGGRHLNDKIFKIKWHVLSSSLIKCYNNKMKCITLFHSENHQVSLLHPALRIKIAKPLNCHVLTC
jgi:hypothetical protein